MVRLKQEVRTNENRDRPQPIVVEMAGMMRRRWEIASGIGRVAAVVAVPLPIIICIVIVIGIGHNREVIFGRANSLVVPVAVIEAVGGLPDIVAIEVPVLLPRQSVEVVARPVIIQRICHTSVWVPVDRVDMAVRVPSRIIKMTIAVGEADPVVNTGQVQHPMPWGRDRRWRRQGWQQSIRLKGGSRDGRVGTALEVCGPQPAVTSVMIRQERHRVAQRLALLRCIFSFLLTIITPSGFALGKDPWGVFAFLVIQAAAGFKLERKTATRRGIRNL